MHFVCSLPKHVREDPDHLVVQMRKQFGHTGPALTQRQKLVEYSRGKAHDLGHGNCRKLTTYPDYYNKKAIVHFSARFC